jgi:DNA polymerase-3 subunit gamma/tau
VSTLTLAYRPHTFSDVVGQNHVKPILKAMVKSADMPPALIFGGTRGTGKTTCARVLAAALNCIGDHAPGDSCGECAQCVSVQKTNSMAVLEVDAASNGGVDEVRKIREMCLYSTEAEWRVVLLDEAHSMSKEAFNALLKLLEEPPEKTVFVLLTTETDKILDTVRSRAMTFEFRRIKQSDLFDRLKHVAAAEEITIDDALLEEIASRAQGGMRDAVMLLDQVRRIEIKTVEEFRESFGIRDYSVPLMWSAVRGDYSEGYRLISENFSRTGDAASLVTDLSRLTAELLVIKSDGRPQAVSEESLKERVTLSKATTVDALVRVVEVLWDLRERVRETENDQRSSMELGFALIASALAGPKVEAARPILKAPEPQPVTIDSLRETLGAL